MVQTLHRYSPFRLVGSLGYLIGAHFNANRTGRATQ
jgi:hypothetical protein